MALGETLDQMHENPIHITCNPSGGTSWFKPMPLQNWNSSTIIVYMDSVLFPWLLYNFHYGGDLSLYACPRGDNSLLAHPKFCD